MADNATEALGLTDGSIADISKRAVRALTEPMTVLPDVGRACDATGLFVVISHSGNSYLVDAVEKSCECPDSRHRDPSGGCKHVRRARYAVGETPMPGWVEPNAVDDCLAVAVDGSPVVAVTDGGAAVEQSNADAAADGDARPDDCDCGDWNAGSGLCCWPCYRDGHRTPASDGGDADE